MTFSTSTADHRRPAASAACGCRARKSSATPSSLAAVAHEAVEANGLAIGDVDLVVPHQANIRILDGVARKLGVPADRLITTVDRHANTSAASIPLALDVALGEDASSAVTSC